MQEYTLQVINFILQLWRGINYENSSNRHGIFTVCYFSYLHYMDSFTPLIVVPVVIAIILIFRRRRRVRTYTANMTAADSTTDPSEELLTTDGEGRILLCIVEKAYIVSGTGLVVMPGPYGKIVRTSSRLKLIRPDGLAINAKITMIDFHNRSIGIGSNLTKEDVPIGTEVWLDEPNKEA